MKCPICNSEMEPAFTTQVLGKYDADFFHCSHCGFLRIANPHWLEEAYSNAIAATDTGLVIRNIDVARKLAALLYFVVPGHGAGRYLDVAGGYGLLTRLMRDFGFDFYWSDKYCTNLFARGFEFSADKTPCQAVTAIEVMEHVPDPSEFVKQVLKLSGTETFIFTTELYAGAPPHPEQWWYYSLTTGQHISFYTTQTLTQLAKNAGMTYQRIAGLHIFTRKTISPFKRALFSKKAIPLMLAVISRKLESLCPKDHQDIVSELSATEHTLK